MDPKGPGSLPARRPSEERGRSEPRRRATRFIATAGDVTTLSADGGGDITERYKELGNGLPSKPVFYRDLSTGLSSVMVQTSDTTVHVETVTLSGKLWGAGSRRTVD